MKNLIRIICTGLVLCSIMATTVSFAGSMVCDKAVCIINKDTNHTHQAGEVLTGEKIMNDTCHIFLPIGNGWLHHELPIIEKMKPLKFEVVKTDSNGLYVKPISEEFGQILEECRTEIKNSDIYSKVSNGALAFNTPISPVFLARLLQLNPNVFFEYDGQRVKSLQELRNILKLKVEEGKSKIYPGLSNLYDIDGSFVVSKKNAGEDDKNVKAVIIKYEPNQNPIAGLEHGLDVFRTIR